MDPSSLTNLNETLLFSTFEILSSGLSDSSSSSGDTANRLINVFLLTTGSLSLLGSTFILVSFVLLRDWSFPNNLIFFLTMCDFFWTATYFAVFDLNGAACVFQAVWGSFWGNCTTFWTFFVAFTYWSQFTRWKIVVYRRGQYFFHAFTWLFSLLLSIVPIFTHDYEKVGVTRNIPPCWLINSPDGVRFWAYYIWVMLVMLLILILYGDLIVKLRSSALVQSRVDTFSLRWYAYPLIYWFVWLMPSILRILEQAYPTTNFDTLVIVQSITMPLQGFLNSIVYGFRSSLIERIKAKRNERRTEGVSLLRANASPSPSDDYPFSINSEPKRLQFSPASSSSSSPSSSSGKSTTDSPTSSLYNSSELARSPLLHHHNPPLPRYSEDFGDASLSLSSPPPSNLE